MLIHKQSIRMVPHLVCPTRIAIALLATSVAPVTGCRCMASEDEPASPPPANALKCQGLALRVQVLETKRLLLLPNLAGKITIYRADGSILAQEPIAKRERTVAFDGLFFARGGILIPNGSRFELHLVDARKKLLGGYNNLSYGVVSHKLDKLGDGEIEVSSHNYSATIECQKS